MKEHFFFAQRKINQGRTFIVAEISANHNGKLTNLKKIILAAKKSGADAVKIQSYEPESITIKSNDKDFSINTNNKSPWKKYKNFYNLYKFGQTPIKWHKEIFNYAKKINIPIFSSPFDEKFVDVLENLKCIAYKIASPEINHFPLLKKVASTGKPIIISSGVALERDISKAISYLKRNGTKKIILLKCDTSYPSDFLNSNLSSINYLKKKYRVPIGFSDHTEGNLSPIISVMFGACMIEKHFNIKNNHSLDSFFSSDPKSFKSLVDQIRILEKEIKTNNYKISEQAKKNRNVMRSIYISKNVKKDEIISPKNIRVVRPAFGLSPIYYEKIIGKKFDKNYKNGQRMSLDKVKT